LLIRKKKAIGERLKMNLEIPYFILIRLYGKNMCPVIYIPFDKIKKLSGKQECLNVDWFIIGFEDGAHDYPTSRIGDLREACAKHGVTPDFGPYEQGRLAGLKEYCTPQRGYGLGASGKPYNSVCPDYLEEDFLTAYHQGKELYSAQMIVNKQEADLKKMHQDLANVKQRRSEFEAELIRDSSIGQKRRKYLLEEIKILTNQEQVLQAEIIQQEDRLAMSKKNLIDIRARNPY
jgi:hypothetical protein